MAKISWLHSPVLSDQRPSKTDTAKRLEIFNEFIYFVFDSLLIPLIRNTFYVTESNTHRYQVFYFRHEVWRHIAEPAMMELRADMFEEVKLDDALQVLRSRKLGFSQVRLLPKGNKLRPIMNLRRRVMTRASSSKLGRSINTILGPVHSLLKLEKVCEVTNLPRLKLTRNPEDQPVQVGFNHVLRQRYLFPAETIQAISGP